MVPYAISLTSKLLFGAAAAEVVRDRALFAAASVAPPQGALGERGLN
jgi:hypothetical protein